jgi:flagellar basal body rod protein FlgC
MLFSAFSFGQPCKSVKVGMPKLSVEATTGKPDRIGNIANARTSSAMEVWTYGNQQVIFNGDVVERIVADVKRENELTVSVNEGKLTNRDYQLIMEKVNSEGCK